MKLRCLRMELGEPDRSGRRRPIPIEGSDFELSASLVIGAIGQSTNTQFLYNDLPVRLNKWGDIDIDGSTMQTSEAKIFAGGDCVTGPATVIQAVAAGRRAAWAMDQFVTQGLRPRPSRRPTTAAAARWRTCRARVRATPQAGAAHPMPALEPLPSASLASPRSSSATPRRRPAPRRPAACAAAARPGSCCDLRQEATAAGGRRSSEPLHVRPYLPIVRDHPFIVRDHNKCISCGRCVAACAEIEGPAVLAYQFRQGHLTVGTHNGRPLIETDCVSCGQCVTACPCGALDYVRERRRSSRPSTTRPSWSSASSPRRRAA